MNFTQYRAPNFSSRQYIPPIYSPQYQGYKPEGALFESVRPPPVFQAPRDVALQPVSIVAELPLSLRLVLQGYLLQV